MEGKLILNIVRTFDIYNSETINENNKINKSDIVTLYFHENYFVLYDGFNHFDGQYFYEYREQYKIKSNYIDKILSYIPNEFKDISILKEYCNSNDFYNKLPENYQQIFICILNYFRINNKFKIFLDLLNENNVDYESRIGFK